MLLLKHVLCSAGVKKMTLEEELLEAFETHKMTPTVMLVPTEMTKWLTQKSYGPYIRNHKQFWRNYHREIKHPLAKTYLEVSYINVVEAYKPLFCGEEEG